MVASIGSEYIQFMSEIKARMNFIRLEFAARSEDVTITKYSEMDALLRFEGACLQLRKILELTMLACLVTHQELLQKEQKFLRKENDLRKIAKKLSETSPFKGRYLPISVHKPVEDKTGVIKQILGKEKQLASEDLISAYGKLGDILHSRNPNQNPAQIPELQEMHGTICLKLIQALQYHVSPLHDGRLLLTFMNGSDEAVTCSLLNPKEFPNV